MSNDSPGTIAAAVMLSVIGVFGLIPQPLIVGALQDHLAFTSQQAGIVTAAEIFAGALSSILAAFWIRKVNWRTAALFAISVVVAGNALASFQTDYTALLVIRGLVGLLGQGTVRPGLLQRRIDPGLQGDILGEHGLDGDIKP